MRVIFLISVLNIFSILNAITLQKLYNDALPGEGYQKLIILEGDSIYTGGLIQDVQSLCIHGNGAIIDLMGASLTVEGENQLLDIDHCVFKSSSDTPKVCLEYKNNAYGRIINNTFWGMYNNKKSYLAIYFEECMKDTSVIINNIFSNFSESIFFYTMNSDAFFKGLPLNIEYNLHWLSDTPYLYWGGWTGEAKPFTPIPGNGEKIDDPKFIMPTENNFGLKNESICIDNGTETDYEYYGNDPDIGALESSYSIFRGTKLSGYITENLTKANSPYIIIDDVIIREEDELSISPGVRIRINYLKSIIVNGELQINGSIDDSVKLTNNSCYKVPWGEILFEKNSSVYSHIKYTRVEYGSSIWKESGAITCLNDSISIDNCYFTENQGAIYCGQKSKAHISNNIFYEKYRFSGKGVIMCAPLSKPYIDNNILYASFIYADSANPKIVRNKFLGQDYQTDQQYWLLSLKNKTNAHVESNFFTKNYGAIQIDESSNCSSINNLFVNCDNSLSIYYNSTAFVLNNTIYSEGYGISCSRNSKASIINSIIWNIGEWSRALRAFDSSEIVVKYCALSTDFEGEEIIFDDPLFSNPDSGDFHLQVGSPCIDSGDPDTSYIDLPLTDFDGKRRIVNGQIDIGCFEYQHPDKIGNDGNSIAPNFILKQNYPNPFNSVTIISFTLPKRSYVLLDIYDISGRKIQALEDGYLEKDVYSIKFDAKGLASGIYYYRLRIDDAFQQIKRMVHLK